VNARILTAASKDDAEARSKSETDVSNHPTQRLTACKVLAAYDFQ
jgi:hypothetical protein